MKRLSLLLVVGMALFSLMVGMATAGALEDIQKRGTLRVGMEPGYMPFELTNQKGEIIGFDVDMATAWPKPWRKTGAGLHGLGRIIPALLTKNLIF